MKILDQKGKLFGKISIVDIFVILFVIACIVGIALKFREADTVTGGDRVLTYQVKVNGIRQTNVKGVEHNGVGLIDYESKKEVGNVINVEKTPHRTKILKEDGSYEMTVYENRTDLILTITVTGTETDDAYFTTSGRRLTVGDDIGINNGFSQFSGEIISVEATEK